MIQKAADRTFTRTRLKQLIAHARRVVPQEAESAPAEDFDWTRPHHFSPEHLAHFELFSKKMESALQDTFNILCQGDFEVAVTDCRQHFACRLADEVKAEQRDHSFLPLSLSPEEHGGFLNLSPQTAISLVGYMLRDPDFSSGEVRPLSKLEDSILMDITAAAADAVIRPIRAAGGPELVKSPRFVKGDWPVKFEGLQDLFSFTIVVTSDTGSLDIVVTLLASVLEPIMHMAPRLQQKIDAAELTARVMQNMHRVPIEVNARLVDARMTLNDLMNLNQGDILVLGKKINEPLEVLLNGKRCLRAWPAACGGRYALVITPPDPEG